MSRAHGRALILASIGLIAAAALGLTAIRREPDPLPHRSPAERPRLLLLTSLPLIFGEDFSLGGGGSPALNKLQERYRVVPISVASTRELAKGRLLLLAQPLAQTAENLVALDDWVRTGGRVLLLADPMLEWPSKRPLGDPLRPPPMFADTGLLAHWGLRLDAPEGRGPIKSTLGGFQIVAVSPGQLYGRCSISADRLAADCHIGSGEAIVVADADFIGTDGPGAEGARNLDGLVAELATLEQK
jgi:hypothetical protein